MSSKQITPVCPKCLGRNIGAEEPVSGYQYHSVLSIDAEHGDPALNVEEWDVEGTGPMTYGCNNMKCGYTTENVRDFLAAQKEQ